MANENAIVSVTLSTQDLLNPTQPTVVNRSLLSQIYSANQVLYNGYLTTTTTVQSANLITGGQTAAVMFIRNAGSAFLQINTQSAQAGGSTVNTVGPSGFIFYFSTAVTPTPTPTGVVLVTFALAVTAAGTGIVEVFIAI